MKSPWSLLSTLWGKVRAPKVSDEELERRLRSLRKELPAPVFWLLGKAQSGKTSLIRAITGSSRAEIGGGFRPCTRTAQLFPFPSEKDYFLQFLDTRGLGEVDYDPSEDLGVMADQSHCLIVVIKAMDHAQRCVLDPLKTILAAHPDWPLIVVQTSLHEGYPGAGTQHLLPYPYAQPPYPAGVPQDLARSLIAQQQWFAGYKARVVPVDFTLPEDSYEPEHYGLEALWSAIEEAMPLGLRAMLQESRKPLRDVYFQTAHPHVVAYSLVAGGAAGVPVPLVDIPLIAMIQAKMFHSIASIYGQPMTTQRIAEVVGTLGLGFAARMGGRELCKLIPGFGSAVAAVFAAASTYALGCTLCAYFSYVREGDVPDPAVLRTLYKEEFEEGRRLLAAYLGRLGRGQASSP
jgi:uncharacterized protein (DUF697 family)/predicted GTPase